MIDLKTFLSSIIADTARGQAQADYIAAEIAELYKEHDLLKFFPVPKISISSIDFECSLAIQGYRQEVQIPEEAEKKFKSALSAHLNTEIYDWPETRAIIEASNIKPQTVQKARAAYHISEKAHSLIEHIGAEYFMSEDFKKSLAPAVSQKVAAELVKVLKVQDRIESGHIDSLQNKINQNIQEFTSRWWDDYIRLNPRVVKHQTPLLAIESGELADIPPEKMTRATIHLEIRPYEWTSMEVEDEKRGKTIKYKLVPE